MFKKFQPLESKLKVLAQKLMDEPLYLSDEYRDYKAIWRILINNFIEPDSHEFYEIGDFGGIIGFVNICPTFKADIVFKLWDKDIWGFRFKTEVKKLIKLIMHKYDLKRIATETPDERMVRVARMCNFKVEGRFKYAFKWNDELYTLYKLRVLKEEL